MGANKGFYLKDCILCFYISGATRLHYFMQFQIIKRSRLRRTDVLPFKFQYGWGKKSKIFVNLNINFQHGHLFLNEKQFPHTFLKIYILLKKLLSRKLLNTIFLIQTNLFWIVKLFQIFLRFINCGKYFVVKIIVPIVLVYSIAKIYCFNAICIVYSASCTF